MDLGGDDTPGGPANQAGLTTTTTAVDARPTRTGWVSTRSGSVYEGIPRAAKVPFAVLAQEAGGYRVLDVCNREGWLSADQVVPGNVLIDRQGFGDAVFVIDAGHGAPDEGAIGPSGLHEAEVNLDVASRVVELLGRSNDIDWTTGRVMPGSAVPPAHTVIATRPSDGPNRGDFEVGLTFRASLANAVGADAFVSIHHNSGPTNRRDTPGSEAYVSAFDTESQRLGALMLEELRLSFSRFDAEWSGGNGDGLIARIGSDGNDYYTVIAVSEVPAVIVEGLYISSQSQESLARTDTYRQAYAEAVYRALVRFVSTADRPDIEVVTQQFDPGGPSRSMDDCVVPTLD
jgi:N-acetylmuramoyl-L-alanine amidase